VGKHWRVLYENVVGGLLNGDPGLFTGIGISWFDNRNVVKFAVQPNSNFGFSNFPLSDTNLMHRLPVFSYSRNF